MSAPSAAAAGPLSTRAGTAKPAAIHSFPALLTRCPIPLVGCWPQSLLDRIISGNQWGENWVQRPAPLSGLLPGMPMPKPKPPRAPITYRKAGVDIDAGSALVAAIKPLAKSTERPGAVADLGGFGALFDLKRTSFKDPLLVA